MHESTQLRINSHVLVLHMVRAPPRTDQSKNTLNAAATGSWAVRIQGRQASLLRPSQDCPCLLLQMHAKAPSDDSRQLAAVAASDLCCKVAADVAGHRPYLR